MDMDNEIVLKIWGRWYTYFMVGVLIDTLSRQKLKRTDPLVVMIKKRVRILHVMYEFVFLKFETVKFQVEGLLLDCEK